MTFEFFLQEVIKKLSGFWVRSPQLLRFNQKWVSRRKATNLVFLCLHLNVLCNRSEQIWD